MGMVDIVLIVVLAVFGIIGFAKGFLKQIGKLITMALAIIAAVFLYEKFAGTIYGWFGEGLVEKIGGLNEAFTKNIQEGGEEAVKTALSSINIPGFAQDLLLKQIDFTALPNTTIAQYLGENIICTAIAFLTILIGSLIILSIICAVITKAIDFVPGASTLNRILGLVFNAGKIVVFIWALFYGISFLAFMPSVYETINGFLTKWVEGSKILKFLMENNGVTWLMGLLAK